MTVRRLALPLLAVFCCYALYCRTLPKPAPSAAAWSPGRTAELTLPAIEINSVALGPYAAAEEARAMGAKLVCRGAAACVRRDGISYRVLLCLCEGGDAALSAQKQLHINEKMDVGAYQARFSATTVRIHATEDQIAAVSAALEMLKDAPEQLNRLAEQIDRGLGDIASARTLAEVLHGDIRAIREQLEAQTAGTENPFCLSLARAADYLDHSLEESLRTREPLELSSALRQMALELSFALGEMGQTS